VYIRVTKMMSLKPSPIAATNAGNLDGWRSSHHGALHIGHISLIEIAKRHAEKVAVSIFVNPTQFGPREDFKKYPRPIETDLTKCRDAGSIWFSALPKTRCIAKISAELQLDMPGLSAVLEGRIRPQHFRGVCQVVAKLFNILSPQAAVFGQKDYQQFIIIKSMVQSLDWPVEIIPLRPCAIPTAWR